VALTAAGETWLTEVRPLLAAFDRMLDAGRRASAGDTGRLRIGFGYHTLDLVPRLLVKLRRTAPAAMISLRDQSTAEQLVDLQAGHLDIGFLRLPLDGAAEPFHILPVLTDRIALVVPGFKDFAGVRAVADLDGLPVLTITPDRSPGFHRHMLALCAQSGFHPRILQTVTEFTTAIALARAGMGVAFVPESIVHAAMDGVRIVRLTQRTATWSVGAVWKRADGNPLLLRFVELLRKEIQA
jgi:DNA-binding transcriptional LysR family regulator